MFALALRILAVVCFLLGLILLFVSASSGNLPEAFLLGGLAAFAASFFPLP